MKNKHIGFLSTFFTMCIKFTRSKKSNYRFYSIKASNRDHQRVLLGEGQLR